ncbi:outer membrane protein assembly factor BamB family protein [Halosimplex sp. J119]
MQSVTSLFDRLMGSIWNYWKKVSDWMGRQMLNIFDVITDDSKKDGEPDEEAEEMFLTAFRHRSWKYLIAAVFSPLLIIAYFDVQSCGTLSNQTYGLGLDLAGAIILGRGLIKGRYSIQSESAMKIGQNVALKRSMARDSVDGVWGISLLFVGILLQFMAVSSVRWTAPLTASDICTNPPFGSSDLLLGISFAIIGGLYLLRRREKVIKAQYHIRRHTFDALFPMPDFYTSSTVDIALDSTDWPLYRKDPQRTGNQQEESAPQTSLVSKWNKNVGNLSYSPIAIDDRLFVGTADQRVLCLDSSSGNVRNEYQIDHKLRTTPAVISEIQSQRGDSYDSGYLIVGASDIEKQSGNVTCFNVSSGVRIWRFTTENPIRGSPNILGQEVIISDTGTVYGLDPLTGKCTNSIDFDGIISDSVAVHESQIIVPVGGNPAKIKAISFYNENKQWEISQSDGRFFTPAIYDEVTYISSRNGTGHIYAINVATGTEIWSRELKRRVFTAPAVSDNAVFVGTGGETNGCLYALDREDGTILWKFESSDTIKTSPVIIDEAVSFGCDDGSIYLLDIQSGAVIDRFDTNDQIIHSAALDNESLYFCNNNCVYSLTEGAK